MDDIVNKNDMLVTLRVKERKLQSPGKTVSTRLRTNNKLKPHNTRSTNSVNYKLTSGLPFEMLAGKDVHSFEQ